MQSQYSLLQTSILALVALSSAQSTIVPTTADATFPACALSCGALQTAQAPCAAEAATNIVTGGLCFCAQPAVQGLYQAPAGACADVCTDPNDQQTLQSWYVNFCQAVGRGQTPSAGAPATTSSAPSATTSTTTSTAGSGNTSGSNPDASDSYYRTTGSEWWRGHWQYIVMVIVLIIAFAAIAVFAVWWRRRTQRKRDHGVLDGPAFVGAEEKDVSSPRLSGAATPDMWGPHQHMAATHGYRYSHQDDGEDSIAPATGIVGAKSSRSSRYLSGSTKRDSRNVGTPEITEEELPPRPTSTRPRPSELDQDLRAAEQKREVDSSSSAKKVRKEKSVERANREDVS